MVATADRACPAMATASRSRPRSRHDLRDDILRRDRPHHTTRRAVNSMHTCASCGTQFRPGFTKVNIPLAPTKDDVILAHLPIWIDFQETWKGKYHHCISACESCAHVMVEQIDRALTMCPDLRANASNPSTSHQDADEEPR